jgi:hypothetical protein
MYEEIGKPLFGDALPEAVYLYGSRASTLLAAMDRFGVRELALTCYGEDDGFKKILGPVVRDDALLSKIANRCGVSDLDGSRSGNA